MRVLPYVLRAYQEAKRRLLMYIARPMTPVVHFGYAACSLITMLLHVVSYYGGASVAAMAVIMSIASVAKDAGSIFMVPHHWRICSRRVREWSRRVGRF